MSLSKEQALEVRVNSIISFSPSKPEMLESSSLKLYRDQLGAAEYDDIKNTGQLIPTKCIVKKIKNTEHGLVFFVVNLKFPKSEPKPYHWTYFENIACPN